MRERGEAESVPEEEKKKYRLVISEGGPGPRLMRPSHAIFPSPESGFIVFFLPCEGGASCTREHEPILLMKKLWITMIVSRVADAA